MAIGELLRQHDSRHLRNMNLYHGSGFLQTELKPGFQHSGKLVNWDRYESNDYLYVSSDKNSAILLGIVSALEKKFDLVNSKIDHAGRTLRLIFNGEMPSFDKLYDVDVWVYTLAYSDDDEWVHNKNPYNGIETEYKTKNTVKNIVTVEKVNVQKVLNGFAVHMSSGKK